MEELAQNLEQVLNRSKSCETKWENEFYDIQTKLSAILLGTQASAVQPVLATAAAAVAASPQQMKKRPKRLSAVTDVDDENDSGAKRSSKEDAIASEEINEPTQLEEVIKSTPEPEHIFARPMRAAKLKTENCFKELSVNAKMRRPDNFDESSRKIKSEQEQRPSQANKSTKSEKSCANESVASSKKVDESLVVVPEKDAPVVEISEEEDASSGSNEVAKKNSISEQKLDKMPKNSVVKIKKEKLSTTRAVEKEKSAVSEKTETTVVSLKLETASSVEETLQTTVSAESTTSTTVKAKRGRKKKEFNHRPIKEERLSTEPVVPSPPVSTRTRSGNSISKSRPDSIYEDAVDNMPQEGIPAAEKVDETPRASPQSAKTTSVVANDTVAANNVTMVTACDATFVTNQADGTFAVPPPQATFLMENNPNATVTITNNATAKTNGSLGDATFDVRDPPVNDSIMTEDDSFDKPLVQSKKLPPPPPPPRPAPKSMKTKSKQHELFNPCVQSPVKMKVEAFEHRAQTATQETRLKTKARKVKENSEPELPSIRDLKNGTATTPVIGKPHAPALGRFLTPTQQSNVTPLASNTKKLASSASKIMPFPTSKSASNLKSSNSTSSQSLSRENSDEDLKKGFNKLQQLAEERKRKRELKHQQAAQMREAKEKERADRLHKLMKEREEKNRKKVIEMEQKKRDLEEINRNLKQQEERELKQTAASKQKVDAAEAMRQERELLDQMKMPKMKMPPPPPKLHSKYNFNMLQSDDSTDEEGKTSYKRPAPPLWSKSSARTDCITIQTYLSSDIIDSFFSVQPMTPDLKAIFPNIDPRYLKRNSSAIWQTPPRYSEMPKY